MMTDDKVIQNVIRGTTSRPKDVRVLYNDGRKAIVKHLGRSAGSSPFRYWHSSWVDLYDLERPMVVCGNWSGKTVWDCATNFNGRLTHKRLVALVESLGLNVLAIRIPNQETV